MLSRFIRRSCRFGVLLGILALWIYIYRTHPIPDKDRPVWWAAVAARATHLLTGDVRHFGSHFGKTVQGVHILRPAAYLAADALAGDE